MELTFIISQTIIILGLFSIGYPLFSHSSRKLEKDSIFLKQLVINIIIQINIILLLTFINISLDAITKIYFLYLAIILIFITNKNLFWIYSKKYYFYFIFLIFLILSVDIAHSLKLDWDSQIVWFYKTLNFFDEGTIKDLTNLPTGDGYSYPYLGSLLWAFFWNLGFIGEEYSGRLVYVFLYIISLLCLADKLNGKYVSKIIFLLFLLLISYDYIFFAGSQDILIFCFISLLAFFIHEIFLEKKKKLETPYLIAIPLIFNCLIWTKNEGVIYSFLILFILTFFSQIKFSQKIFFNHFNNFFLRT